MLFFINLNIQCLIVTFLIICANGNYRHDNRDNTYDTFSCCSEVYGSCRTTCESISLVHLAADSNEKDTKLQEIKRFCPSMQVDFWNCMNRTLNAVSRGSQWSGRPCCPLALSSRCQNSCATASSRGELQHGCRQSDEQNLFSCLDRQEAGEECCGNARSSECLQACKNIFRSKLTPTKEHRNLISEVCDENNSRVLQCVKNYTEVTTNPNLKQYLPCCEFSKNVECRSVCRKVLPTVQTTQETIDTLEEGGCGPPLPHDPLWQCFLSAGSKIIAPSSSSEVSRINQIGMDSAKLHCCHKAVAPKCRRLCTLTFSNDWTETRGDFDIDCIVQMNEIPLRQCIDEVDEPCELGCDGLSFCSNFNNRPTELFRSCNAQADVAARLDVALWQENGFLTLPGIELPIRNVSKCSPEIWRAIACTLQIKPCTRNTHTNQICREDCYDILSKCLDWTRMKTGHTAASICSKLSPEDLTTPCVSLKPFLEPSDLPLRLPEEHITTPCKGEPCNATQVCLINRDGSNGYSCVPGCSLGEASPYLVPFGTFVRIPVSSTQKGCLKICKCGISGRIESCQPLPCITYDSCNLAGRRVDHASWFYVECNICSCFAGEITCTKKQCKMNGVSDRSYTSLPCNCPPHYVPVCGKNGKTYPSTCVAKCAGHQDSDLEFGACNTRKACENNSCQLHSQCYEDKKVCLSSMHRPCQQYECINTTTNCNQNEPVCDVDGQTFLSICHLAAVKGKLAYRGRCFTNCRDEHKGPVCGINGVTYNSECEAWSDYSWVDYQGICQEIGLLSTTRGSNCQLIKCNPLPSAHCPKLIPPGACCPICAGAVRIVYSRKQVDRALYALKGKNTESLTLRSIMRTLENLIQISQCRLTGYLTIEADLFVSVHTTATSPSVIQIEACTREAEKIATLISTQSHRITSELSLSALTVANIVQTTAFNKCSTFIFSSNLTIFLIIYSLYINCKR